MAIHGISGAPGAGKTSLAMEELARQIALNVAALKAGKPALVLKYADGRTVELERRPLFVANVDGLVDGGDEYSLLPDASRWNEIADGDYCDCLNGTHQVLVREGLRPDGSERDAEIFREELGKRRMHGHLVPDGAWILVDEAWAQFGHTNDARGRAPPLHVQALAEHRHRSIDFCWTFQGPSQIYPFVRPLIAPHWHTVARFGQFIDVYKWGEFVEDVKSQGMRDRGQKESRTLPTKQRSMYRSASGHTGRPKFPKKMIAAIAGSVVAIGLLWVGVNKARPSEIAAIGHAEAEAPRLAGALGDGPSARSDSSSSSGDKILTPEEYAAQFKPRILGVHGSQPIFGDRQVKAQPATYCMIAGEGLEARCSCFTEQATRILDVLETTCRDWARNGIYDPFRAPLASGSPGGSSRLGGPSTDPAPALTDAGELRADLVQDLELEIQGRSAAPASGPIEIPGAIRLP